MDRAAHVNVTHLHDVEADVVEVGELRLCRWAPGEAAGAFRAGVSRVRIGPGLKFRVEPLDHWDGE